MKPIVKKKFGSILPNDYEEGIECENVYIKPCQEFRKYLFSVEMNLSSAIG